MTYRAFNTTHFILHPGDERNLMVGADDSSFRIEIENDRFTLTFEKMTPEERNRLAARLESIAEKVRVLVPLPDDDDILFAGTVGEFLDQVTGEDLTDPHMGPTS